MTERRGTKVWDSIGRGAALLLPIAFSLAVTRALRPRSHAEPALPEHAQPESVPPSPAAQPLAVPPRISTAATPRLSYTLPQIFATEGVGIAPARILTLPAAPSAASSTSLLLGVAMALWFAAAYLWQYRLGGQFWPSFRGTYAAGPYLWVVCSAIAFCAWKSTARPEHERNVLPLAFVVGAFAVAATLLAGLVAGLGHSPYARSPFWLLTNTFYVGAPLLAFEFARAYVIRMLKGRVTLAVASTAFIATVLGFSYRHFLAWEGPQPELIFLSSRFLPDLASNLLASFLVYLGGPFAGIVYRGIGEMFEWYSPILANLPWLTASFVGVAAPAIGLWVLEGLSGESEPEANIEHRRIHAPSTAWVLTATASLAILWFTFGFFGVKPSFIPSQSMEPTINPGSIVITRDINPDDVRVGDIVMYQRGRTHVLHRVIEKRPDGTFIFKGDHNNTPDPDPVQARQIEARLILDVPYIGWVPIWASRGVQKLVGL